MAKDQSQRVLNNRKSSDFVESCCVTPRTWDTDTTGWDTTPEVFDIIYYNIIPVLIYVGPE